MYKPIHISPEAATDYLAQIKHPLEDVHAGNEVSLNSVIWPNGLDRSIIFQMLNKTRVHNCLVQANFVSGNSPIRAYELLQLPNFGQSSLIDLLFSLEKFLIECISNNDSHKQTEDKGQSDFWSFYERNVSEFIAKRLCQILDGIGSNQHAVLQGRILQRPSTTLKNIGRSLAITRERVRQIQFDLEQKIEAAFSDDNNFFVSVLPNKFRPAIKKSDLERNIDDLLPNKSQTIINIFQWAVVRLTGFTLHDDMYTDEHTEKIVRKLKSNAKTMVDDVGLVEENKLVKTLPDGDWKCYWPELLERCAFYNFYGSLGTRDTKKARVKAALMSIGHPATRDEIRMLCGYESNRVGSILSVIPSIVRADKERWGLREWVDKEYGGITEEIIQQIKRDGGATHIDKLLAEIPLKHNVKPQSVRAYMKTPRFEIRNNLISLAKVESIQLRPLDDVIGGRDESGAPYWSFVVDNRYFEGYSVIGIPPEFAEALGCKPDSNISVRVENVAKCRELTLRWGLHSTYGASLGYVAEPLRQLGFNPGEYARITIKGKCLIELTEENNYSQSNST